MKQFGQAIRDSFHHWPLLVIATLCSVGVATLWSANIGAMYPVIEMTLKGNSSQHQLGENLAAAQERITQLQTRRLTLKTELSAEGDEAATFAIQSNINACEAEIKDAEKSLGWTQWQLDLANRFLPQDAFNTICFIMFILVMSTLVKHLLMLANDLLIGQVSTTIVRSLRTRVFNRALAYDRKTYETYGTSGLLAAITHTSDGLSNGLIAFFGLAIREPLRILACLIGAAMICWQLLLASLILAPLMVLAIHWFNGRVKGVARLLIGRNAGFHEVILEALGNIFTVQAYTMEDEERARFGVCTKDMQRCGMRMIFYAGVSKPITELIGIGMIAVTVCAGAYLIVNQATHIGFVRLCNEPMTPTTLMVFFAMLIGASDPLRKMSGVMTSIFVGAMSAESLYHMLEQPQVLQDPKSPTLAPTPHSRLSLSNVSFAYVPDCPVLKGMDLDIPFGKTVAIVGTNGSGKSTLVQLLCRFYDPIEGSVNLDGIDFRQMSIESIRKRIALVSQHTELFNRSVLENIRYGSPQSTREEAIEAAKLAHAHEFISNSLDAGYETRVGQGGQRLSGGQRQRIAMARAILRKPEILILDESTSQIDMSSELQIRQSLKDIKGSCTIVIITHREALIALADQTYEVCNGVLQPAAHKLKTSA